MSFDYDTFTTRNFGFISTSEQARLRDGAVFVVGVGGMGGACLNALVRAGVGRIGIADIDRFELSNLNRQIFAFTDTIGQDKAAAAAAAIRRINPDLTLEVLGAEWTSQLRDIAARYPVIVNGSDDIAASIHLYRVAREAGACVIDAYAAPLPSVILVRPDAPRPEERLRYPTCGKDWTALTPPEIRAAFIKELEYVMVHSSSARHVDLVAAGEMAAGKRPRMSFAPMVVTTGNLMAYEALGRVMGRNSRTDHRGWFLNPYAPKVERPLPWLLAAPKLLLVRRAIARLTTQ